MISQVKGDLTCLVRNSIVKIHSDYKPTWGGNGLFHLHFQVTVYIIETSQGMNLSSTEHGSRKLFKSQEGLLFTVFSQWFSQFSFITEDHQARRAPTNSELCPPR